jgi:hypothetical protein
MGSYRGPRVGYFIGDGEKIGSDSQAGGREVLLDRVIASTWFVAMWRRTMRLAIGDEYQEVNPGVDIKSIHESKLKGGSLGVPKSIHESKLKGGSLGVPKSIHESKSLPPGTGNHPPKSPIPSNSTKLPPPNPSSPPCIPRNSPVIPRSATPLSRSPTRDIRF